MQVIALIGGPLDGVYLPANPDYETLSTHLYVYSPDAKGWSLYTAEDVTISAGADVYSLRRGAVNLLTTKPSDADVHSLVYSRPLTVAEVAEIKRMGKQHGL